MDEEAGQTDPSVCEQEQDVLAAEWVAVVAAVAEWVVMDRVVVVVVEVEVEGVVVLGEEELK